MESGSDAVAGNVLHNEDLVAFVLHHAAMQGDIKGMLDLRLVCSAASRVRMSKAGVLDKLCTLLPWTPMIGDTTGKECATVVESIRWVVEVKREIDKLSGRLYNTFPHRTVGGVLVTPRLRPVSAHRLVVMLDMNGPVPYWSRRYKFPRVTRQSCYMAFKLWGEHDSPLRTLAWSHALTNRVFLFIVDSDGKFNCFVDAPWSRFTSAITRNDVHTNVYTTIGDKKSATVKTRLEQRRDGCSYLHMGIEGSHPLPDLLWSMNLDV